MKRLILLLIGMASLVGSVVLAQTGADAEPAQPPTQAAPAQTEPAPIAGTDAQSNGNSDENLEPAQESQARFIPTEQISQDLGVSFPVDI